MILNILVTVSKYYKLSFLGLYFKNEVKNSEYSSYFKD